MCLIANRAHTQCVWPRRRTVAGAVRPADNRPRAHERAEVKLPEQATRAGTPRPAKGKRSASCVVDMNIHRQHGAFSRTVKRKYGKRVGGAVDGGAGVRQKWVGARGGRVGGSGQTGAHVAETWCPERPGDVKRGCPGSLGLSGNSIIQRTCRV